MQGGIAEARHAAFCAVSSVHGWTTVSEGMGKDCRKTSDGPFGLVYCLLSRSSLAMVDA